MDNLTEDFAQNIVDSFEQEAYDSTSQYHFYCLFCGTKHEEVLDKKSGYFIAHPRHSSACIVIKAKEYLEGYNERP